MKILPHEQGSPPWLSARTLHFCASDAPAMMGVSKYKSRSALLREKSTGITEDIDANKQAMFDAGHATEAMARKIIEEKLGLLTPIVATDEEGWLLASFDGVNEARTIGWEHKLWNELLASQVRAKELDPMYYWQLEQQIIVGGFKGVVFTVSDGTRDKMVSMKYLPVPGRAEQLIAGWKQFESDLAAYVPPEVVPDVVAAPMLGLPALSIQVNGSISLIDNLKLFGEKLTEFVGKLDMKPVDDQGFADSEAAIKILKKAEESLEAAESSALAQTASIDAMRKTVAMYVETASATRILLQNMVKDRKETVKADIVAMGKQSFADHVARLNARLGKPYMPLVPTDFPGVIKGQKTVASLRNKVDTELARAKIAASAIADGIQVNLTLLRETAKDYAFLFADTATIVLKPADDFAILVKARIAEHEAAEAKRKEDERARIQKEVEAAHQKKLDDEAAAQRKREAEEAAAKIKADEAATKAAAQQKPLAGAQMAPENGRTAVAAAPVPAQPAPATSAKPTVKMTSKGIRPDDDAIIGVLTLHYRVHESKVIEWLLAMDLDAASNRMAREFA